MCMNLPRIDPNQVSRPLYEPINGYILFIQVFQNRPPRTVQIADIIFFAQIMYATPIGIRHGKPLTIARTNVYIYRAEIVILLMTRCAAARHFHV